VCAVYMQLGGLRVPQLLALLNAYTSLIV